MQHHALVSFLRETLGISVRAAGYLDLVSKKESHPDDLEKAQKDVGKVIGRLDLLIKTLEER